MGAWETLWGMGGERYGGEGVLLRHTFPGILARCVLAWDRGPFRVLQYDNGQLIII